MRRLLPFLLVLTTLNCLGQFVGYPWTNHVTWTQCRTDKVVAQLFEAVRERCYAVTNRCTPPSIVETWEYCDGYTNEFVNRNVTINGTNVTIVLTNRLQHTATLVTTNQLDDVTIPAPSYDYVNFCPLSTNPVTTQFVLSLPVTRGFVAGLDAKIAAITPFYVDAKQASSGIYDPWFAKTFYTNATSPAYGWWYPVCDGFSPPGGYNSYVGATPVGTWTFYWQQYYGGSSAGETAYGYATYYGGHGTFTKVMQPQDWPYLSAAAVMENAHIGFVTNKTKDVWGRTTGGNAYYTRQPLVDVKWDLWQATRIKADVTLSGFGSDYDGDYFVAPVSDYRSLSEIYYRSVTNVCYVRDDGKAFVWYVNTYGATFISGDGMWSVDTLDDLQHGHSYSHLELDQQGTNTVVDPWFGTVHNYASNLKCLSNGSGGTNGWRYDGESWFMGLSFGDPPAPSSSDRSLAPASNLAWKCRSIAPFDYRYYDDAPRPRYYVRKGTNVLSGFSISVHLQGAAFVNFDDPDYDGQQVTEMADENIELTSTNTASTKRWGDVIGWHVTGDAPNGTEIELCWTRQHSYGELPYRLEVADLKERADYLKELLHTTTPYWQWKDFQYRTHYGSSSNFPDVDATFNFVAYGMDWFRAYPSQEAWNAAQPPGWGAPAGYGDWTGWRNPATPLPWYTTYPSFAGGSSTPWAGTDNYSVPKSEFGYGTRLDWSQSCAFQDAMQLTIDPHLMVDEYWELEHGYYFIWDVNANSVVGGAPECSIDSLQWWSSVDHSANVVTTNSDTREEHTVDFYYSLVKSIGAKVDGPRDPFTFVSSQGPDSTLIQDSGQLTTPASAFTPPGILPGTYEHAENYSYEQEILGEAYPDDPQPIYNEDDGLTEYTAVSLPPFRVWNQIVIEGEHQLVGWPYPVVDSDTPIMTRPFNTPTVRWSGVLPRDQPPPLDPDPYAMPVPMPAYTYNDYNLYGNLTYSNSVLWKSLPKATDPLTIGVVAYTEVDTNIFTVTVENSVVVHKNIDYWFAYAPAAVSNWVMDPRYGNGVQGVHTMGDTMTFWFTHVDDGYTMTISTNVTFTNVVTHYVTWPGSNERVVGYRNVHDWHASQSQGDSGTATITGRTLDPLMKWDVEGGFVRK